MKRLALELGWAILVFAGVYLILASSSGCATTKQTIRDINGVIKAIDDLCGDDLECLGAAAEHATTKRADLAKARSDR